MIKYQNIISCNKHTLFKYFSVNMVNIVIPLVDFCDIITSNTDNTYCVKAYADSISRIGHKITTMLPDYSLMLVLGLKTW